jgi:hypothetical protein
MSPVSATPDRSEINGSVEYRALNVALFPPMSPIACLQLAAQRRSTPRSSGISTVDPKGTIRALDSRRSRLVKANIKAQLGQPQFVAHRTSTGRPIHSR